jgi:hypothetical protein
MDIGILPRHQLAVVPDDAIDLVERNSHGLSPGLAQDVLTVSSIFSPHAREARAALGRVTELK